MQKRPLLVLAALAAATEPDFGRSALDTLKGDLQKKYGDDPMGTTVKTVLVASWLFYRAERGKNPKVTSFYDALVFVTTSLSVGYSDIFAKTPAGKAVASALMTVGPAMAAGVLEDPNERGEMRAVVERLDRLIATLEQRTPAA